ncbi:recombinase family protein [Aquimarina sp. ERC-38]|uniref:recombinase family protein n=1 Tax=Aquimarina sp. ERC-38 TaxID=2949996 RepID=UPI00224746C6|nr:recombinase family protein [Aquimarina sp. ERC-38]UZO81323.1 recombinase family protein [Aquimarina sp. ERC-38]
MEPFIDTTSVHGKFIFTMFSAVAQLERDIIVERTLAGRESARRRGAIIGRKRGLGEEAKKKQYLLKPIIAINISSFQLLRS